MENTKLSIGIVVAIVMQVGAFVWWTAQQAQTIEDLEQKVSALTAREVVTDEVNSKRDIQELKLQLQMAISDIKGLHNKIKEEMQELDDDLNEAEEEIWDEIKEIKSKLD